MSSVVTTLIAFSCIFGGALFGMFLHSHLPKDHLTDGSKNVVNLGAGVIGTMAALVLGLLVASAKSNYDIQNNEVLDVSAKLALLDRVLAQYGPEAQSTREHLRDTVAESVDRVWPINEQPSGRIIAETQRAEAIFSMVQDLTPTTDDQKNLKSQALSLAMNLGQTRWLLFAQQETSVSKPLVAIVVFWLTINFISFGLFAPRNATVITTFLLCALAVSGAIFLILQMYTPFEGPVHISSAPLRNVLAQMGK